MAEPICVVIELYVAWEFRLDTLLQLELLFWFIVRFSLLLPLDGAGNKAGKQWIIFVAETLQFLKIKFNNN